MPPSRDHAQSRLSSLSGEFEDRDLERRFRVAVLADWQWRLRAAIVVLVACHLCLVAVDYRLFGLSRNFFLLQAIRALAIVLSLAVTRVRFTPDRIRLYDWCATALLHMVAATFNVLVAIKGYNVMAAGVMMVTVLAAFYVAVPNQPLLTLTAAAQGTVGFLAFILPSSAIRLVDQIGIAVFLIGFNAIGAVTARRIARLERQRFATQAFERRITARLEAQRRGTRHLLDILTKSRNEAKRASRAKSDFLAGMSHELRTPLNAITGFSEIIENALYGPLPERYRECAADIRRAGEHLTALVNDILDLSKIEAGRVEIQDETVRPRDVLETSLRIVKEQAYRAGLTLLSDLAPDLPYLRADERLVMQVLLNLLTNAIKFTPAGGEIKVVVRVTAEGTMTFGVHDSGIGIAAEDIPHALEPYGQVAGSRALNPHGTGLGLPLVKQMMDLHDGTLLLDSVVGSGTVATVAFPKERVVAAGVASEQAPG